MKILILSILACEFFQGGISNNTPGPSELNGTWIPIRQEIGGIVLPGKAFKNQKLVIMDSSYMVIAESIDKGIIRLNGDKMDIFGKEGVNSGKHFTALFKFADERLMICYNLTGDRYPEEYETRNNPAFFISVFVKEKNK